MLIVSKYTAIFEGKSLSEIRKNLSGNWGALEKQDRHFSIEALRTEWKLSKDKKSAGIDNISPIEFGSDLDTNLYRIYKSIYSDSFGFRELKVIIQSQKEMVKNV